jgi:hypothetical protein
LNKKTAPWPMNTQGYDRLEGLEEQTLLPPFTSRWFRCATSSRPPKNSQGKHGRASKKSRKLCFRRFTTIPIARSKDSLSVRNCQRYTRTPSSAMFTLQSG